jgi:hypothetical protein
LLQRTLLGPRVLVVVAASASACTTAVGDRCDRHAEVAPWTSGFTAQFDRPVQWGTEAALLVSIPVLSHFDEHIDDHVGDQGALTGGNTRNGDYVAVALGAGAVGVGAIQMARGDEGRSFEVALESLLATEVTTLSLKYTVNRPRPDESSNASFPSGHTSLSFCGATFLARSIEEAGYSEHGDAWWSELGWLAFIPATWVGINRIESHRHFASDVATGALVGVLSTNWVFDAHFGGKNRSRDAIYAEDLPARHVGWSLGPCVTDEGPGLLLAVRF